MKAKRGRVHGWAGWRAGLGRIVLTTLNKCERERVGGHSKSRRAGPRVCRQSFLSAWGHWKCTFHGLHDRAQDGRGGLTGRAPIK